MAETPRQMWRRVRTERLEWAKALQRFIKEGERWEQAIKDGELDRARDALAVLDPK